MFLDEQSVLAFRDLSVLGCCGNVRGRGLECHLFRYLGYKKRGVS